MWPSKGHSDPLPRANKSGGRGCTGGGVLSYLDKSQPHRGQERRWGRNCNTTGTPKALVCWALGDPLGLRQLLCAARCIRSKGQRFAPKWPPLPLAPCSLLQSVSLGGGGLPHALQAGALGDCHHAAWEHWAGGGRPGEDHASPCTRPVDPQKSSSTWVQADRQAGRQACVGGLGSCRARGRWARTKLSTSRTGARGYLGDSGCSQRSSHRSGVSLHPPPKHPNSPPRDLPHMARCSLSVVRLRCEPPRP